MVRLSCNVHLCQSRSVFQLWLLNLSSVAQLTQEGARSDVVIPIYLTKTNPIYSLLLSAKNNQRFDIVVCFYLLATVWSAASNITCFIIFFDFVLICGLRKNGINRCCYWDSKSPFLRAKWRNFERLENRQF